MWTQTQETTSRARQHAYNRAQEATYCNKKKPLFQYLGRGASLISIYLSLRCTYSCIDMLNKLSG